MRWLERRADRRAARKQAYRELHELHRRQGRAAGALLQAVGDEEVVSAGYVHVNGALGEHAFNYRMTASRLLWNRSEDPGVDGFALGDVRRVCLAHAAHVMANSPALRVDLGDRVLDLYLTPDWGPDPDYSAKRDRFVASFVDHIRRSGATYDARLCP